MANAITEGKDRELPPDRSGEILRAPTPAFFDLRAEVLAASSEKEGGQGDAARARSSIESRTDLRVAATNEVMRAEPNRAVSTLAVDQETARRWADLDAADFGRIRSNTRREAALESIAGHVRASPEYAAELKKRSPAISDAVVALNTERDKQEREAAQQTNHAASDQARMAALDLAALAAVASVRARETARVVDQLAHASESSEPPDAPDTATQRLRDAQQSLKVPPLDGRVTAPNDPDNAALPMRAIKRPVTEEELSQVLLTRYIVSQEQRGLFNKGSTEFTFRDGNHQGRLAFVDAGKSLTTELEDKSTIRAMVEVAIAKNWKEITVSGSDDFRRNAWFEASLNGLQVRGYDPREADKQLLAELRDRLPQPGSQDRQQAPAQPNAITVVQREQSRAEPRQPVVQPVLQPGHQPARAQRHIDGDSLTLQEKTVLDNSRAFLDSRALGPQFTEATLRELESKLRGERVYIGEIVDHGKAPYRFDRRNDDSYFVTLKTPSGEQVVWGKGLAEAVRERSVGEQVVLQNIGKRDVTVEAGIRNEQGVLMSTQTKGSRLNEWQAEPLSLYSVQARDDLVNKSARREPVLGVYDIKAPRASAASDRTRPANPRLNPELNSEAQRNGRQR